MTYQWLLFDADDTLFDYPKAEAAALHATFEQFGQPFLPEHLAHYQVINQRVWSEFEHGEVTSLELRTKRFRLLFEEFHSPLSAEAFSQQYLANLAIASHLLPDALDVVRSLAANHHLALVTNGLKDVQRPRLERSAIRPFIEKIFISEEIGTAKPDPAFFEAVFQEIGSPPKHRVLIIGDSLTSDMQGGVVYGIDTCWVNPSGKTTGSPVTYVISSLKQLLDILR